MARLTNLSMSMTSTTHFLWAGRWIPATRSEVEGEPSWVFANERDAAAYLAYRESEEPDHEA